MQSPARENAEVLKDIRTWLEYQEGQSILLTTPSVLVGFRVEVYRAEGTTQWYTAVIQSYNDSTRVSRRFCVFSVKIKIDTARNNDVGDMHIVYISILRI